VMNSMSPKHKNTVPIRSRHSANSCSVVSTFRSHLTFKLTCAQYLAPGLGSQPVIEIRHGEGTDKLTAADR